MTGVERYRALERRRDSARRAACDELPQSIEASFAAELDEIWWTLTDAEQRQIVGKGAAA